MGRRSHFLAKCKCRCWFPSPSPGDDSGNNTADKPSAALSVPTIPASHSQPEPIAIETPAPLLPCAPNVSTSTTGEPALAGTSVHTEAQPQTTPTPPGLNIVWAEALKLAKKKLVDNSLPLDLTNLTSKSAEENIKDIIDALGILQRDEKKKRWSITWRGKKVIFVEHLGKILKTVEPYSNIVGTAIQSNPLVAAPIWAGILAIMQVAVNHVDLIEGVEAAIAELVEKVAICEFYAGVCVVPSGLTAELQHKQGSALPEFYAAVIVFAVKARSYFEGKAIGKIASTLKSFNTEFKPFIDEIKLKEDTISKYASAATMGRIRDIKGAFQDLTVQLDDISTTASHTLTTTTHTLSLAENIHSYIKGDKIHKLLTTLSPLESLKRHQDVRSPRAKNTGTWLLSLESFCEWRDGNSIEENNSHVFCCYGIPGAGKTVICSIAFDNLYSQSNVGVACLYADYKDQSSQTLVHILGSFLRQFLTTAKEPIPNELVQKLEEIDHHGMKVETKDILALLKIRLCQFQRAFICIDAVDELETQVRHQLLSALKGLVTSDTRLFLTGRSHVESEVHKHLQVVERYKVTISAREQDIQRFVEQKIADDPNSDAMDEVLKREIVHAIVKNSQGMFLLPALHIRIVLGMLTKSKRRKALETLPTGLYDSFQGIITRIRECSNACQAELGMQVLMWLHFACRPLKLRELQHALAVEKSDKEFDRDNIPSCITLLDCCLGLVVVDDETLTVRFVHYTLEEYFQDNSKAEFPNGHIPIAETCLTYINFGELKQPCTTVNSLKESMHNYDFLEYAAVNWGIHVQQQCNEGLTELVQVVVGQESKPPCRALQALYLGYDRRHYREVIAQKFSGIHAMAYFGLSENIAYCCKAEQHMDFGDDTDRTPLSWAAEFGHKSTVQILTERVDVNINSTDERGWSPLLYAAQNGHDSVVRLLAERDGVDINVKENEEGNTLLHKAAAGGHEAAVRVLLEIDGVDIDAKDDWGQTPFMWAIWNGHEAIVRLLIERDGVDIDVIAKDGWTPLMRAAWGGYEAIVRLLIEKNVDINVKNEHGRTPLWYAAEGGHEAAVRLLIGRNDVDIDTEDKYGQTALSVAARSGHNAIVQLLEDRRDMRARSPDLVAVPF